MACLGLACILTFSVFAVQDSAAFAQPLQERGLKSTPKTAEASPPNGNYHALVIGIDAYRSPLPRLKTAVNDATAIGKLLDERYGFKVKYLLDQDATRSNILDAMIEYRNSLNDNDSLLIYYAGHGYSDHEAEKAYWLPVDAESAMSPNRISADDLTTAVRVLPARHVLIVSDSCYSGGLSRDADEPARIAGRPAAAFLKRMLNSRSRTLMASGGDEPVADNGTNGHSVFAFAILRALDRANEPMFTASDLFYNSIRQQVAGMSNQLPQYSFIQNSGHDEGDFVFTRRMAVAPPKQLMAEPPAPDATSIPGEEYSKGNSPYQEKIYALAIPVLRSTCEGGFAMGCTHLGVMYENGFGIDKDAAQATALYRKACDGGHQQGCTHLGVMYQYGTGVARDGAQAAALYRQGCDGGEPAGCTYLGWMYASGTGVNHDDVQAAAFFRKGCDGGFASGCTYLGLRYAKGVGVDKDDLGASALYRQGCDGGDPAGCTNLGLMYGSGIGVSKDDTQALALYRKGCDGGELHGCVNLGVMYENGSGGIDRDVAQAEVFYQKGCEGGDDDGCQAVKRLKP
jgi:hypothetical protein